MPNISIEFFRDHHVKYFKQFLHLMPSYASSYDSTRASIAFFALSGLDMLNALDELGAEQKRNVCDWIYSLQVHPESEGSSTLNFAGREDDGERCSQKYACGHLAMTYTCLASLVIMGDDLKRVNRLAVIQSVRALQQPDGSFCSTLAGGESDMRFIYCAACICYILQDWTAMDIERTVGYILHCCRYDYGMAQAHEMESHGGVTYCGVATLVLMGRLHDTFSMNSLNGLRRWLLLRQIEGFQGRPNKPQDTCYSFWVGATLKMLDCFELVDFEENRKFLLSTQDRLTGGFSKWVDYDADPLHTYLGLCGLSLMGGEEQLRRVNPSLNISERASQHLASLHVAWHS